MRPDVLARALLTRPSAERASKPRFLRFVPSSSLHHRQQHKHYLTADSSPPMGESVFALRVEENRPMAGRPIWKTHSEYTDRLGISRGHIHHTQCVWKNYYKQHHLPMLVALSRQRYCAIDRPCIWIAARLPCRLFFCYTFYNILHGFRRLNELIVVLDTRISWMTRVGIQSFPIALSFTMTASL
jgi:hypothetical protein